MTLLTGLGIDEHEVRCCPDCGAREVRVAAESRSLNHTHGSAVKLSVVIPIWTCKDCRFAYTDGRGQQIEQEAVESFLQRRLLPHEVRSIRVVLGLSREQFALLTGYGTATIKRWENGTLVQNASADRFLRLIADSEVAQKLLRLGKEIDAANK